MAEDITDCTPDAGWNLAIRTAERLLRRESMIGLKTDRRVCFREAADKIKRLLEEE